MDVREKKFLFFLLVCWISFEGCAGTVFVTPEVTLWVEDRSDALSCQLTDITPSRLSWRKGEEDVLATWDPENGIALPDPNGKYNITTDGLENFDLIIKNISVSDADSYTCVALEGTGSAQFDTARVTVNDAPIKPYVTIDDCHGENDCYIDVFNETETRNLTCRVKRFFPNLNITWSSGGVVIDPLDLKWHLNEDGTYSGQITITTSPQDEAYVCTATGEALRDMGTMSVRAIVQVRETSTPVHTTEESGGGDDNGNSGNIGLIVGIVIAVLFILMFVLFIVYVLWVKRREGGGKFNYKYTKQKAGGGTVAEDDERRAGAGKSTTSKSSHKPDERDNFRISEEIDIEDKKKPKEEEPSDKSEKSPESKASVTVEDAGDRGGHGGGHDDHHDHSHSSGGGGGGGGGGGHDHSHTSSGGGGGGGGHDHSHTSSGGGGGGGGHDHSHSYSGGGGGGGHDYSHSYSSGGGGGGGGSSHHDDHGGSYD